MNAGGPAAKSTGRLLGISLRTARGQGMLERHSAQLVAPQGIAGDTHADALSPRQVLLAGAPAYDRHQLPPGALAENLLIDLDTATMASSTLLGIGPDAVLALSFQCEACGYLDAQAPGLAKRIGAQRGVLARVLHGGLVSVGDAVRVLHGSAQQWPEDWRERVKMILLAVPAGMVVEYAQLARLAGVQSTYCRAFPRVAREAGLTHVAVAKNARPELPRWDGAGVFAGQP